MHSGGIVFGGGGGGGSIIHLRRITEQIYVWVVVSFLYVVANTCKNMFTEFTEIGFSGHPLVV